MSRDKLAALALWTIVLAGLAVRFYGLGWGLPYHFHSDEFLLVSNAEKLRTASSIPRLLEQETRFFLYPPLVMYGQIALVSAASLVHPISHADPASATLIYWLARAVAALFGAATIPLLYVLGKKAYSRSAGLLAALFLGFSTLHVRDSHFCATDVPLTFFLVLLAVLCLDIAKRRALKSYILAGAAGGAALAVKQTAALMIPVIAAAHVMAFWNSPALELRRRFAALLSRDSRRRLLIIFGVMVLAALVANPFILVNPGRFLEMSRTTARFIGGTAQPQWTFQFTGTTVFYWITNLLFFGMGPLLEAAGLFGILWALRRRKTSDILILFFILVYMATVGAGYMKFIRYAIPLLPFLALLAARSLVELYQLARRRVVRLAVVALTVLVGFSAAFYSLAYLNIYHRDDARVEASRWIHASVPRGTTVLLDISYGSPLLGTMFFKPGFYDGYTPGFGRDDYVKDDYFKIKTLNLFTYASRALGSEAAFRAAMEERLRDVDYIFISDEHYEQFRRRTQEYPYVAEFLGQLFTEKMGFRIIRDFQAFPSLFGTTIDDRGAELTFRLFDHPRVLIFRRESATPGTGSN